MALANFVRGIPIGATLVGLEYQGEQIAGVAEVPGLGHRTVRSAATARTVLVRIRVSEVSDLSASILFSH